MSTSGLSEPTTSSTELRVQFWILVGVFNVAVLATALGVLVLVLRNHPTMGVVLLAVGVGAFVFGGLRYRRIRAAESSEE